MITINFESSKGAILQRVLPTNAASSTVELAGGSSKEPRNSNMAWGIVKLLYEGVLQFVEFLNSKENKQGRIYKTCARHQQTLSYRDLLISASIKRGGCKLKMYPL